MCFCLKLYGLAGDAGLQSLGLGRGEDGFELQRLPSFRYPNRTFRRVSSFDRERVIQAGKGKRKRSNPPALRQRCYGSERKCNAVSGFLRK